MTTVRLVVSGRVQHVGFRYFVIVAAERHGVRGWVRNRRDGSVEIGAQEAPGAFFEEIRRGPPRARIDAIDRSETDEPRLAGFEVRF